MLDFECKHCRNPISIDAVYMGDVIKCPSCGATEIVPETPYPADTECGSYFIQGLYESDQLWTSYRVEKLGSGDKIPLLMKIPTQFFIKHVTNINAFADAVIRNGNLLLPEYPKIIDKSLDTDPMYFIFDYIPTTHGLRFFTKIDFIDILKIVRGIAVALKDAWEKHMTLHLALTSQNIRITEEQDVRIYNIGLSQTLLADHALLDWGFNIWDARYMSPEFMEHGIANSPACDIYSLGGILFYLLTGHHPYETVNPADIARIKTPNPLQFNRDIPPEILSLFTVMMNKDVNVRLRSWNAVVKNLNSIIGTTQKTGNKTQFVDRYEKSATAKHPKQEEPFARSKSRKKVFHKNVQKQEEPSKPTKYLILKKDIKGKKIDKIHSKWKKKK